MDVCTIIAKNYLAHARVLAASFAEHHPDGRFYVLVIDDLQGYFVPEDEPFTVVRPEELGIDGFHQMAVLYNVLELSTSVKPWLMRWLLARSPDKMAVYLDPDMRLYAPLHSMFAAVREHGLVLSPHSIDPMPRDGKRPNEQDILIAGAYNLGFIGIGSGDFADQLLEWWAERLKTDCIVDPRRGFFVDQRWIDLVPGMAESFQLLRDRGFNVAYWNLSSRPISRDEEGRWIAGDVPLRLFHFSGFDQTRPDVLSKHQNRIALTEHPDLAELCRSYAVELLAAGAEEVRDWPYTYASTASGIPLNAVVRNVYRKLAAAGGNGGSVFDEAGERAFLGHLNAPAPALSGGEVGITNYLAALHGEREDLRRAYPDIAGTDAAGYLGWARIFGRVEVPAGLLPPGGESVELATTTDPAASEVPARKARAVGVNVAGYLNSELGVGEVARQAIRALDSAGVPVLPVGIPAPQSRQGHAFTHRGTSQRGYPVNLICVNADMLPAFAAGIGEPFFAGRHSIGWWWWEVSEFPDRWLGSFAHVDELWAGSRFVAEALAVVAPVPVVHVPLPVSVAGSPRADPQRFGLPAGFSFLFAFDYASVLARKNPLGCVEAFLRAFPEPGEAVLVLKSINAEHHPIDHQRVRTIAADHPHIHLLDGYLEPPDKDRLVASCDGYVSLHRSEGFGITLAEAMFLGKPVIATAYSGNMDFMTPENSYLVDYALTPIGPGAEPYPPGAVWAEPDLDHAAALMREVYEDREESKQRADRGYADIRRTHSVSVAGAKMSQRLNTIVKRDLFAGSGWEAPAALERAERADATLKAGPSTKAPSRAGPAGRLARRVALRFMRPHTAHQESIDRDLLDALRAIGRDVDDLGARGVSVETLALRGLRDVEQRLRALLEPELLGANRRVDVLARQVDELRAELPAAVARTDDLAGQMDDVRRGLSVESARVGDLVPWVDALRRDLEQHVTLTPGARSQRSQEAQIAPGASDGAGQPTPPTGPFEFHQQRRIDLTVSCRDSDFIPKVEGAGEVIEREGTRLQRMHNGVLIEEGCYYGAWTTEIIRRLHGHHEPQEEAIFYGLIERLRDESPADPVMVELGSFWAYYSLWFAQSLPGARLVLVEPDPENLDVGLRNLALNGRTAKSVQAAVGVPDGARIEEFVCESDGIARPISLVSVDGLVAREGLARIDVLLCDAQGAELSMIEGARQALASGVIRFLVLSTHHHTISGDPETHRRCIEAVVACGGHIVAEHSVSESYSGDGLIVAAFSARDRDLHLTVTRAPARDSLFGELEPALAQALGERDAALAEGATLAAKLERLGASDETGSSRRSATGRTARREPRK